MKYRPSTRTKENGGKERIWVPDCKRASTRKGVSRKGRMVLPENLPKSEPGTIVLAHTVVAAVPMERLCKDGVLRWFFPNGTEMVVPTIGCGEYGEEICQ